MSQGAAAVWPKADGSPVDCREKLKMLAQNEAELVSVMQDAFDDAILMDVDEAFLRARFAGLVAALRSPKS